MIICDLCKKKVPVELVINLHVYPRRRRGRSRFAQPSTHLCAKCAAGIAEKVFKKGVKPRRKK